MPERTMDNTDGDESKSGSTAKDTSYSPAWDTDIEVKQQDQSSHATDVDLDKVKVLPGTGDPDDTGDVEVSADEINLPRDPDGVH